MNNTYERDKVVVPTLEEALIYIENIDFSMVIMKLTQPDPNVACIWSEEALKEVIKYYKNYLFLLKKYSDEFPILPPSIEIDEIWHHHILDTRKYHEDCKQIFGGYLHHYPYFGMRGEQDKVDLLNTFEITQMLHKKEFGTAISTFDYEEE